MVLQKLEESINFIVSQMELNNIEYVDFEQKDGDKTSLKIKIVKQNTNSKYINIESPQTIKIDSELPNNKDNLNQDSKDLGGFKIKYIEDNKLYIISTLVGKLKLDRKINIGDIINPKQKIGEIEILNIKNPISLEFKIRILDIMTNFEDNVDYGKILILAERIEDGNS
ncbi:MAG: hypothetical protein RMJ36_02990 [Candidatus Calescibacterium sp.]|nr:hypothetical protein [Candidatus Calescibacterium sp.]MDW8132605.1 hypothetical protein [Candidatus Calescibacterium sp.]